jgi:hypothetical protein
MIIDYSNLRCPHDGASASRVWSRTAYDCEKGHHWAIDITQHGATITTKEES